MKKLITFISFCICCFHYCGLTQPKLILPIGHTTRVYAATFSPDGKKIVTASRDNTAKVWDAQSGTLLADLQGHDSPVMAGIFSPDSKKILTTSKRSVKLWDAQSGALLNTFKSNMDINSVVFSPDGKKICIASDDSTAMIRDVLTGKTVVYLKGHHRQINTAIFSRDGKKVLTASDDSMVKIWDALTGRLLVTLKGHHGPVASAVFSPDGKIAASSSFDSTAKIWDMQTGKMLISLKGHQEAVISAAFSPDGKRIVTSSYDSTVKIWNVQNGGLLFTLKGKGSWLSSAVFSPDGKKIATASFYNRSKWEPFGVESENNTAKIWDVQSGTLLANLKGHIWNVVSAVFSPDNKKILTASWDGSAKLWDAATGSLSANLSGHSYLFSKAFFSPDGKKIVTNSFNDSHAKIWDATTGTLLAVLSGHTQEIYSVIFSPDSRRVVTTSADSTAKIWDVRTGELLSDLREHKNYVFSADFSPDGKLLVTGSGDFTAKIWDAQTGKLLINLAKHKAAINSVMFSPDGKKIVTASFDKTAKIWDVQSGNLLADLTGHSWLVMSASFSADGKKIVTVCADSTARIWNAETGVALTILDSPYYRVRSAQFNPVQKNILLVCNTNDVKLLDVETSGVLKNINRFTQNGFRGKFSADGKKLFVSSIDSSSKIFNAASGDLLADLKVRNWNIFSIDFSPDNKKVITTSFDGLAKIWDAETGELAYSFVGVDSSDYLVIGKYNQYDGSPGARKLLYFVCNDEVIGLDQVKDQLWVPNLAERINNSEAIHAKRIDELDLCDLTPSTEEGEHNPGEYCFRITARRGGLGETILYVNGIEAKRFSPAMLVKNAGGYELKVKKEELGKYFVAGQENPVTIKAYTADNTISSRIITVMADETSRVATPPNLYAVIVGISDYKGEELDLKYAAKDATDISNAIAAAARKLLNTDNREHVFMYNMTTSVDRYQLPEKNSIKKLLADIGKKAVSNDLLLIFFAGHGVMEGDKKQFYFLTADASMASAVSAVADVGISTAELTEWMKPDNIKAQKRILIFDACKSGQAIKDFVKIGADDQNYMVARSDEIGQQIKAIEKLNEKSGLFILSASASDQKAYETGRYSQGLLTYSLLKVIKEQADILEDGKYLNVSRWFNAAEKTVSEISKENGARQEPQIVTNTNFNVGMVDEEVIATIVLPAEKPLFAASNLQNADENIADDNLEVNKKINQQFYELSSRETGNKITYVAITNSPDAWLLSGRYEVKGEDLTVKVNVKQNKEIKYRFEVKGNRNNLGELAANIVRQATDWVEKNK